MLLEIYLFIIENRTLSPTKIAKHKQRTQ